MIPVSATLRLIDRPTGAAACRANQQSAAALAEQ